MDSDSDYQPDSDDDFSDPDILTVDEIFDQIESPIKPPLRSFHENRKLFQPNTGNLPSDLKETSPPIVMSIPTLTQDESGHPSVKPDEGTCHYGQPVVPMEIEDSTFSFDSVDGPTNKANGGHSMALQASHCVAPSLQAIIVPPDMVIPPADDTSRNTDGQIIETIFDEECNVISTSLLSSSGGEVIFPILLNTPDDTLLASQDNAETNEFPSLLNTDDDPLLELQGRADTNEEYSLEECQDFGNGALSTLELSSHPEPVILDNNSQPICDIVTPEEEKKTEKRLSAKDSRMRGEKYIGFRRIDKKKTNMIIQDVPRNERKMGLPCSSQRCRKFLTRKCAAVTHEQREDIFYCFWKK